VTPLASVRSWPLNAGSAGGRGNGVEVKFGLPNVGRVESLEWMVLDHEDVKSNDSDAKDVILSSGV
jgi:hypothetical protein